ncbi:MAG: Fic family protein [Desulfobacteraceae bacterium]|nr:Fic family protein [Desulfobacteraceae bacterium]
MAYKYKPPYTITTEILNYVVKIGEILGELKAETDTAVVPKLRRDNKIKTIQASLAIEGNTLSLEQVTAVIAGKRVLGLPREVREVRNTFTAYEELPNWSPHSRKDLLAAHGLLMAGLADETGCFRSGGVGIQRGSVVVHMAPPASQVSRLMDDLLSWLRRTDECPLVKSCLFHYEFEFIHPFQDGNGRLGRLWQTLILSRWRPIFALLPVESVIRDRQQEYYTALRTSDNASDATPFVTFMLSAILQALEEIKDSTDHVTDHVTDQVKRLLHVIRNSQCSASEIMAKLGLSHRPTFRKNYLQPALHSRLIEMTHPDTPRSRNQQYRITARGTKLLTTFQIKGEQQG